MVPASVLLLLSGLLASAPSPLRATPLAAAHRAVASTISVSTSLGTASGVADTRTVNRFSVKYATAERWQTSVMATKWELPNNSTDPSDKPLACPQGSSSENSVATDEDCLSMILYVPASGTSTPTMMWIHGGSFVVGSATGPGLDAAALANATGSIVAVVQYRLGAFGFLSPSGDSNLAVKDMIVALEFLQKVVSSFGGNSSMITIAGQSSGASMVRALLAAPVASSLFESAIMQSDPMDYSFLSMGVFTTLNDYFISELSCSTSDSDCLTSMSTEDVLTVSTTVFNAASSLDGSLGSFEPMRPVKDGSVITTFLDATETFPGQFKTVLVSTVQNEAGPAIYGSITSSVPESEWPTLVNATFGSSRTSTILNSTYYTVPASYASNSSAYDARGQLENLGTDQIWRCPSWTFARLWAAAGGTAYVGEYIVGATYPDNEDIDFCTQGDTVCHEDDIEIVFGTVSSPTSAQSSLIMQIQARYKAFLSGGSPNVGGYDSWTAVSGNTTNVILLGGDGGSATVGACDPSFWGSAVEYDYQVYNS